MRSPKAWKMLRALPSRPAERTRTDHPDGRGLHSSTSQLNLSRFW
jgi:hypothetical protein